jgi:hypothetical protein
MSISCGGDGPLSSKGLGGWVVGKGDGNLKNNNQPMMGRTQQSANNSKMQWAHEGAAGDGIGGSGGRQWDGEGEYETHPIEDPSGET